MSFVMPAACELTMEETELLGSFLRRRTDISGAPVHADRKA